MAIPPLGRITCARKGAALLTLLLVLGCGGSETGPPVGPGCPDTGISGTVTVGGHGVLAGVQARSVGSTNLGTYLGAGSDSSGRFFLPVVPGRYLLDAASGTSGNRSTTWCAESARGMSGRPDTIRIEPGRVFQADFAFGTVTFRLRFPDAVQGRSAFIQLWDTAPGSATTLASTTDYFVIASGTNVASSGAVGEGSYAASITIEGLRCRIFLPGSMEMAGADAIEVRDCGGATFERDLSFALGQICGQVLGSWQSLRPPDNPILLVFTPDSVQINRTEVAADGSYRVDVPVATQVRLMVWWHNIEQWMGGPSFAEAQTFTLASRSCTEIPPYTEGGVIIRLVLPDPLMSMSYRITLFDWAGRRVVVPDATDGVDMFQVANLAPGAYRLFVEPRIAGSSDCLAQWYDGGGSMQNATPIEVRSGADVRTVNVRLVQGGTIRAHVRRADGHVTWGACILIGAGSTPCIQGDYNSAYPPVELRGIPDGRWKFGIRPYFVGDACIGFDPSAWTWFGGATLESATAIEITHHDTVEGVEIVLP